MTLKVGKLYSCSKYYLMLYPDKEAVALVVAEARRAAAGRVAAAFAVAARDAIAAYWSKRLKKPVSYSDPLTPILVLSVKEKYHEVMAGYQKGWIIIEDWLDIKEIV